MAVNVTKLDSGRMYRRQKVFDEAQAANEAEQRSYDEEIERRLGALPGMRLRLVGRWLLAAGGVVVAVAVTRGFTYYASGYSSPTEIPVPFILGALWAWALSDMSRRISSARSSLKVQFPPPTEEQRRKRVQDALDSFDAQNP